MVEPSLICTLFPVRLLPLRHQYPRRPQWSVKLVPKEMPEPRETLAYPAPLG